MTTPQARCEQIARELMAAFYRGETGFVTVEAAIATTLLAAEERGRQEAGFSEWCRSNAGKLGQEQQSEPARECADTASEIVTRFMVISAGRDVEALESAIAAALQAERTKLASVEESARRVIEQAVQVLATRPITGERHTVLTELEAWLAEHLAPVKPCPEDGDVQRESAEKP